MEQDFYELFIEISKQIELIASSLQKLSRCVCDPGEISATSWFNHSGDVTVDFSGDEILIGPEDLVDNKDGGF